MDPNEQSQGGDTPQNPPAGGQDPSGNGGPNGGEGGTGGSGEGGEKGWITQVPTEHRELAKEFDGFKNFLNAGVEAIQTTRSQPKPPESPDGYDLSGLKIPEGIQTDPNSDTAFKQVAHKLGLTPDQAKNLRQWGIDQSAQTMQQAQQRQQQARTEALNGLQQEWGDKFEARKNGVQKAFRELGDEDFATFMINSGLGDHPVVLKHFYDVYKQIADDTLLEGQVQDGGGNGSTRYPNTDFSR